MLNKEKTILESPMAYPNSSLPKPLCLYLGILLLLLALLTGCSDSVSQDSTLPTSPASDSPTLTAPARPTFPVEETALPSPLTQTDPRTVQAGPCPPSGEPDPLPDMPFAALPEAVLAFLNSGGSLNVLDEALYQVGVANLPEPVASADMDGDGVEEVVVSIFEPGSMALPPPGMLLIYTCQDGVYHMAYQEDTRPSDGAPGIRFLRDLNANGRADLVVSSASCGAHTCFERVQVIQWDGETYRNHLEGETTDLPYPTIYLSPTVEDEIYDLQVTGSGFGSVGAGPQRDITRTWSFSKEMQLWQISSFRQEPSNYRIHILHDAAAAAKSGDYQQALGLYNRVISDSTLEDWSDPDLEQAWIKAFAQYQMVVIYTLQDREGFANTVLADLQDTTSSESPQSTFYKMAVAYIDGYQEGGVEMGCSLVQDYAALHPGLLDPLGSQIFGYGNPDFTEQDICP